jgi:tRNA-modifying protein YgfZ
MSKIRAARLPDRGFLRLAGPDARAFLQGLITADIARLAPDQALYAALLTAQGKYLFDFLLHDEGEAILLEIELARRPSLLQRLSLYRLRAKVTIADAGADLAVLALFGEGSAEALRLPGRAGAARQEGAMHLLVDPRLAELGARAVLPEHEVEAFLREIGAAPVPAAEYDRHRTRLAVPDGSRDLVPERSLLLESGFDELGGVSFTKGCFVGQELTARTKHRALIKKRLVPVRVEGPLPDPGTPVLRGSRDAGEMRSSGDGLGLALLRLEQLALAAVEAGPLRAGAAVLTPEPPVWLRPALPGAA